MFPTNTGGRYSPITDTWTPTSLTGAPSPRLHHSSVWTGSEMIVWGGSTDCCLSGNSVPNGKRYNPQTDTWAPMSSGESTAGFVRNTVVWTGDEMIVWGGLNQSDQFVNTGQGYHPDSDTWTSISVTDAPSPRGYTQAVWTGEEMIVWGGYDGTIVRLNTGGHYNPSSDSWLPTTLIDAPSIRNAHTAVWTGSEMIVWGGFNYDGNSYFLQTGGRYQLEDNQPPVVTAGDSYNGFEGETILLDEAIANDPNGDLLTFYWDVNSTNCLLSDNSVQTPTVTCQDNGNYEVLLTVDDGVNDPITSEPATVVITNLAPIVNAGIDETGEELHPISFTGVFTDPGSLDTHIIQWDFGDGSIVTDTLTPTHIYSSTGIYTRIFDLTILSPVLITL